MLEGFEELEVFGNKLLDLAEEQFPKETKQFLRKQGNKLNKKAQKTARERVKRGKSNIYDVGVEKPAIKRYHQGFRRGKVYYHNSTESFAVRVYNRVPHAHLIEYGHVQLDKNKSPVKNGVKFVKGRFVLRDTAKAFGPEFDTAVEEFVDELLDKGLRL